MHAMLVCEVLAYTHSLLHELELSQTRFVSGALLVFDLVGCAKKCAAHTKHFKTLLRLTAVTGGTAALEADSCDGLALPPLMRHSKAHRCKR